VPGKRRSAICKRQKQIGFVFTKKLKADYIRGALAAIKFRIFWLPVSYLNTYKFQYNAVCFTYFLYGRETLSLALRKEYRLNVASKALRRRKRGDVYGVPQFVLFVKHYLLVWSVQGGWNWRACITYRIQLENLEGWNHSRGRGSYWYECSRSTAWTCG
jgi:hypothetical protein